MAENTIPSSILDTLVEDLLALTADGLSVDQAYVAHPNNGDAVIVEAYADNGDIEGRYTVTFNIEHKES